MQLSTLRFSILAFALLVFTNNSFGQATIQDQFETFYKENTSSWQEFKLVKKPLLRNFWTVVSDTLRIKEGKIATAKSEIVSLKGEIESLKTEISNTAIALSESEALNDSIVFMGMQMSKGGYNSLVWFIILGLAAALVALYVVYLNNNRITKEARKNLAAVEEEYTAHQERARETQTKLKRELQTAQNTLQEHRIKF